LPSEISFTRFNSFKIGEAAEILNQDVAATDLKHINEDGYDPNMPPIQGILGFEYLNAWNALIDFSEPVVYLRKKVAAK
jgi:hypothetical protein